MPTFTVSIEISVDAESETPLREIALEGWTRIAELKAPIVQVVDDATGTTHVVDFEEGDAPADFPRTPEEARVCIHRNIVWFGHECGDCEDEGWYEWLGGTPPTLCVVCGAGAEIARPDGKGEQVGYCGEHEPEEG